MKCIFPFSFLFFLLQTLAALPDQDSFYDMVDGLEEQGMEAVSQRHLGRKGTDLDLVEQLNIYEVGYTNDSHLLTSIRRHRLSLFIWPGQAGRFYFFI